MNCIAIPHTQPARRWEVKSLEDAAIDKGLEIDHFKNFDELLEIFDGCKADIPESYLNEVKKTGYPCVHVHDDAGNISCWEKADRNAISPCSNRSDWTLPNPIFGKKV